MTANQENSESEISRSPFPVGHGMVRIAAGFGLLFFVLLIGAVVGYQSASRLYEDRQMAAHTQQVVGALESVFSTVQDAETGLRVSTRFAIEPASRQACRPKVPHGRNREASEALNLDKSATNKRYVRAMERLKGVLTAMPGSREDLPS